LWKHVKKFHALLLSESMDENLDIDLSEAQFIPYSHEYFRKSLVEWIIESDQPFSVVEHRRFKSMVQLLRHEAQLPSADTVKRDIMNRFALERYGISAMLQDAPGRLSFAIDAWTSSNVISFLGITVHWLDKDWKYQNLLLDLEPLSGSHTGDNMCSVFMETCLRFKILDKALAITTDSASNNNTFISSLVSNCRDQRIILSAKSLHVRCLAHVINLAVQEFLKGLNSQALEDENAYDMLPDDDILESNLILKLR